MKYFLLFAKLCVSLLLIGNILISYTLAYDSFNWNNIQVSHQYNGDRDTLEIFVSLENISSSPREDYDVELTLAGKQYRDAMRYSSSRDELSSTQNFNNINSSDLSHYSNIGIRVIGDDNIIVFDGHIQISTTSVTANTNFGNSYIETNNSSQNNSYNNSTNNSYNNSYNPSYNNAINYGFNSQGLATGINSSVLELTADYDTQTRNISFKAEIKNLHALNLNIRDSSYYKAEFTIDGEKYYTYFRYSEEHQSLIAILSYGLLGIGGLDNSYYVNLRIFENGTEILEKADTIRPSKNFYKTLNNINHYQNNENNSRYSGTSSRNNNSRYSSGSHSYNNARSSSSAVYNTTPSQDRGSNFSQSNNPISEGEILAYRYIFKIEAGYHDTHTRITTLNKFISALESVKYTHSEPIIIESMINTIQNRIFSY